MEYTKLNSLTLKWKGKVSNLEGKENDNIKK